MYIGGPGVACWPLVPKFAGSNPAEAVRFLGQKNPQHAFLRRGSKAVGQGRRLRVASVATAPGPALEGAPRFRRMSLSSYILR